MATLDPAFITNPFLTTNELLAPGIAADMRRHNALLNEDLRSQIDERASLRRAREAPDDFGGMPGAAPSVQGAAPAPPVGPFEQQLAGAESPGPGVVNKQGYSGQYQFGAARLADLGIYKPAEGEDLKKNEWKGTFSIPGFAAVTHDDFLKSPAAQHAAFTQHVADIDKAIATTPGAAKLDQNGLRAVAHLGGNGGMQRFVETGGLYDPADANGTHLSDYYKKFAQGGTPALVAAFGNPQAAPGAPAQRPALAGGVQVAGPGAPTAGTPDTTGDVSPDIAWLDEQSKTYPGLAGPNANPTIAPINAPGTGPASQQDAALQPAPTAPTQAPQQLAPSPVAAPVAAGPELNPRGLTAENVRDLQDAKRRGATGPAITSLMVGMQQHNIAQAHQAQQDTRQATNDAAAQAHQTEQTARQAKIDALQVEYHAAEAKQRDLTNKRADEAAARADAKAAAEAEQAGKPYQGTGIEAQDSNVLLTGDPASRQYAGAYARMAAPKTNVDGSTVTPNMEAYDKPTFAGGNGVATSGAAPDYAKQGNTPPLQMTQDQARAATYADRMSAAHGIMNKLDSAATDFAETKKAKVGDFIGYSVNSPDFQRVRQAQEDFVNATLRLESGAVINPDEFTKAAKQYFPQPGEGPEVIAQKKANREREFAGFQREAGRSYKMPGGDKQDAPASVKSDADFHALPSGAIFIDPTGQKRKKP